MQRPAPELSTVVSRLPSWKRNTPAPPRSGMYVVRHAVGGGSRQWTRSYGTVSQVPSGCHADGLADGDHEWHGCRNQHPRGFPESRIIVLTTYPGDDRAIRAFRAGARGFVLKGSLHKELLDTIRAVHAGERRIPPEVAEHMLGDF